MNEKKNLKVIFSQYFIWNILQSQFCKYRPVAGGGAGGARAPPEIFRLELNSATKVEFFY